MDKINIYAKGKLRKVNPDWFTAKTVLKEIGGALKISEQKMFHVYFQRGSRTKLHLHNGNQILIVTQGTGSLETFSKKSTKRSNFPIKKKSKTLLKKGDVVYIKAGTLHTHGSVSKKTFSHIALNILPRKNAEYKTVWYESDFKEKATHIIK